MQNRKDSGLLPKSVKYEVSLDKETFGVVGVVMSPPEEDCVRAFRFVKSDINKVGRYVRVEVEPSGAWSMTSEAQVIK